jgi:hypothetical protein
MKNVLKATLLSLSLLILLSACKKEEEIDPRDQFVGTWKGTQRMIVLDLQFDQSDTFTQIITKDPDYPNKIKLGFPDTDESYSAKVVGNAYTYDESSFTYNQDGYTYTFIQNGGGSINGSVITEGGTVKINVAGQQFSGTWEATLNKQ